VYNDQRSIKEIIVARIRKQKQEQPAFELPENFVPSYAMPEWSKAVSTALLQETELKGSPGFDPGSEQAEQVEKMTALGLSADDIAATLKIEPKLLKKFYKYELDTANARTNAAVAKVALQLALSGADSDMTRFWLKTRAGWKETKVTEVTGANGGPVAFQEVKQRMLDAIDAEIIDVQVE
jgi:hypothetical protein